MPQMAPMSWMMLFLIFTIMLIVITTANYFLYSPTIIKNKTMINMERNMNWKW